MIKFFSVPANPIEGEVFIEPHTIRPKTRLFIQASGVWKGVWKQQLSAPDSRTTHDNPNKTLHGGGDFFKNVIFTRNNTALLPGYLQSEISADPSRRRIDFYISDTDSIPHT